MPVHYMTIYVCDWCTQNREYEGDEFLDEVMKDGWIVLQLAARDEWKTYCGMDCLMSDL